MNYFKSFKNRSVEIFQISTLKAFDIIGIYIRLIGNRRDFLMNHTHGSCFETERNIKSARENVLCKTEMEGTMNNNCMSNLLKVRQGKHNFSRCVSPLWSDP